MTFQEQDKTHLSTRQIQTDTSSHLHNVRDSAVAVSYSETALPDSRSGNGKPVETTSRAWLEPSPADFAVIEALYESGRYLQAFDAARKHGPLREWGGSRPRVLAARIAGHVGAPRLARAMQIRAYRDDPHHPEVLYYYAWALSERNGPYAAWRFLNKTGDLPDASPELRAAWYAEHAQILARLRDFEAAEQWVERALNVSPDFPWAHVARGEVLEYEDRYNEALAAVERALVLRPWYRPAVQAKGHLLTLINRDREARDFLTSAAGELESAAVCGQLAALQIELEDFAAAGVSLDRAEALSPLLEEKSRQWLAGQRFFVCYHLGDIDAAMEHAKASKDSYFKDIIERLADATRKNAPRVSLPVGFVRQHQVTCVPATLSAISCYWSMPADHLQVAEEICYNGTSHYNERNWANTNGWVTREFTVTEQSARQLLDVGIPFTLATVEPGNAHLQAVIGYDGRRGTLTIRDPYQRHSGEALADRMLARYRAFGPRGMALVPLAERVRLESLDLPDASLWDELHELDRALIAHDRDSANRCYEALRSQAAEHRLTLEARRRLAVYDGNSTEMLAVTEEFVRRYPDDEVFRLVHLSHLRHVTRREERLEILRRMCSKVDAHPIFLQEYAQELLSDARSYDEAHRLLKRAIRRAPQASSYSSLADLYWNQRRFSEALELYRFAACLEDKDEGFAQSYFTASQFLKQTETALAHLRHRFRRSGKKSSLPARTLERAYRQLNRTLEAQQVLEAAMQARPDDAELMLYVADALVSYSMARLSRAEELLRAAHNKSPRGQWLRSAARLAWSRGELGEALALWREVLVLQPLAIDAHRAVAQLLAETQDTAAVLAHFEAAVERFPYYYPLYEAWIEWVRSEPADVAERAVRRAVEFHPNDAWSRRELAHVLWRQRRLGDAWAEAEIARQSDPHNDSLHCLFGHLSYHEGKLEDAKLAYRKAIAISVDNDFALSALLLCCDTPADRRDALAYIKQELERQVIFGDGLLTYRELAVGTLSPDELLASLRAAHAARPDLWHAWSACIHQLTSMNRLAEALDVARQATDRFPLLPRVWLDRATVCRLMDDAAGELQALKQAHEINPAWSPVARALAELHERQGDRDASVEVLEQIVAADRLDPINHGCLADALWRRGDRQRALEAVTFAAKAHPGYEWAWDRLREWSSELGNGQLAAETARELCRQRPGEPRFWLALARVLDSSSHFQEIQQALDRAIALSPRMLDAHDARAWLLAKNGRYDEALAACQPTVWGDHPPAKLRSRAAWVEATRGNLEEAVRLTRLCVADEPNDFEAWMRLAEWYRETGDGAGYLEAAEALVRIHPQNELSHGYLGEALLNQGKRPQGKQALQRAFALAPTYDYAGLALFDLQLEDHELDAAAVTARQLRHHVNGFLVTAREIQLAAARNDRDAALKLLGQLCTTPAANGWSLSAAFEAVDRAGWSAAANELLDAALLRPDAAAEAGAVLIARSYRRSTWGLQKRLREMVARGPAGDRALHAYVEWLAHNKKVDALRWFVWRNRAWIREKTPTWASIGYALVTLGQDRAAAKWLSDWRIRPAVESWMLLNLVEALRNLGRNDEAADVSRHAVTLAEDVGTSSHRLWLAADEIDARRFDAALVQLKSLPMRWNHPQDQVLYDIIAVVLEAAGLVGERHVPFDKVRGSLNSIVRRPMSSSRRRFFQRSMKLIVLRFGWPARLWQLRRWIGI